VVQNDETVATLQKGDYFGEVCVYVYVYVCVCVCVLAYHSLHDTLLRYTDIGCAAEQRAAGGLHRCHRGHERALFRERHVRQAIWRE
jgi:hypothetical protein